MFRNQQHLKEQIDLDAFQSNVLCFSLRSKPSNLTGSERVLLITPFCRPLPFKNCLFLFSMKKGRKEGNIVRLPPVKCLDWGSTPKHDWESNLWPAGIWDIAPTNWAIPAKAPCFFYYYTGGLIESCWLRLEEYKWP